MSDESGNQQVVDPEASDPIGQAVASASEALGATVDDDPGDGLTSPFEEAMLSTPAGTEKPPESDDALPDIGDGTEDVEGEPVAVEEGEELDEDEVSLELPDALKEQGFEDIVVSKDQEDLFRALISDYNGRTGLEARETQLVDYESSLMEELDEFRVIAATDPFKVLEQTFGQDAEAADETFRNWLLSDPKRWDRHAKWLESLGGDADALDLERRELAVKHKERVTSARESIQEQRVARQAAAKVRSRLTEILETIAPTDREFVSERLKADITSAARKKLENTGSDVLTIQEVEKIALPWLERFRAPSDKTGSLSTEEDPRVVAAKDKLKARALARKKAKKTVTAGGAPPLGIPKPPRGATLDDVLQKLQQAGGAGL